MTCDPRSALRPVIKIPLVDMVFNHPINRIDELLPWVVAGQIQQGHEQLRHAA